jgi:hypothetical protein
MIRTNQLSQNHHVYNAIVTTHDGTRIRWNDTLGFSLATDEQCAMFPTIYVTDYPEVQAAAEAIAQQYGGNIRHFFQHDGREVLISWLAGEPGQYLIKVDGHQINQASQEPFTTDDYAIYYAKRWIARSSP